MDIERKIDELKKLVSKYDTESFAGFFATFIRNRPDDSEEIELNKFDSKLKDFLYLIALNAFSSEKGIEKFELSSEIIGSLADSVNDIKNFYRVTKFTDYTIESVVHELAFRNHFDNGVLSYVEQDLERVRTTFLPFEDKILKDFGFDIDFLIEIYKETELITKIRHKQLTEFLHSKDFEEFNYRILSKKMKFEQAYDLLPEKIQNAFSSFLSKTHAYLMFTKEDLYLSFPQEKVDKFLELFSCATNSYPEYRYYSGHNPFELAPILKLSDNSYLNLYQKQIPVAIYRRLYDHLINDKQFHDKIRKHRDKNLEKKVVEIFKSFFSTREAFFYENYYIENNCEQDLLILYKGTAIIIETKASKLREPFRDIQKAITRLKGDFDDSIQYGYDQCKRIESYFYESESFDIWDEKKNLLYRVNPNKIHSVYSIVVTLERFGSLQTDLGLMLKKNEDEYYPWSVYIDDLEIFLLTLKHHTRNSQGKLLNFLNARRKMHNHIYAIDELDICATYINDPVKFNEYSNMNDSFLTFSPYEQSLFDQLYFNGKLKFKEKPLPDEFYKYGI